MIADQNPRRRRAEEPEWEPDVETTALGAFDPAAFRSVDGAGSDEPVDPAFQAVIEAGGGVSEGFEQAEALLVEHALDDDLGGLRHILDDAGRPEAELDPGVYGEADEEHTSERPG